MKGETILYHAKRVGMVILFIVTVVIVGLMFTSIRTNAIGAESFEASPNQTYAIQNFEELVDATE